MPRLNKICMSVTGTTWRGGVAAGLLGAIASSSATVAAQPQLNLESVQAQCIHQAMARGHVGERLKAFVDSCVKTSPAVPVQDMQPASTETPAC